MYSQMIIVSNAFYTKYKITYSLVEIAMNPGVGGGGGGGGVTKLYMVPLHTRSRVIIKAVIPCPFASPPLLFIQFISCPVTGPVHSIRSLENDVAWNVMTSTGKDVAECDPAHDCPSSLSKHTLNPLNRQGVGKVN